MKTLLLVFALTNALHAASLENTRPNIVFVLTDDQGMGDLSCMGNSFLKTPNIDAFHKKSTRFTQFQVNPTCTPTRAALMSGRPPFSVGVSHTILCRERLALDVVTFPQALQTAGYKNGIFGKWHLGDEGEAYLPNNRGFDEVFIHGAGGLGQEALGDFIGNKDNKYFDNLILHNDTVVKTKGFCTDVFFQAALGWIKQQVEAEQPYFTYIALNAPHGPFYAPEQNIKRFTDLGLDRKAAARYGMIENIDTNFGLLMQKLEEWKQLENTLVIFMTDNGMSMGRFKVNGKQQAAFNANMKGNKGSLWEGGTRVPSFWYLKGKTQDNTDITGLAGDIDIYKTFCALTGAKVPESKLPPGGRSLLPLLGNPKSDWEDRVLFSHKGRWGSKGLTKEKAKYLCSVRTQKWRFVHNEFLYDVNNDLMQKNDLAAENPEVVALLQKKYEAWWTSVQGPLSINEGLKTPKKGNYFLQKLQAKQRKENGEPPLWKPTSF